MQNYTYGKRMVDAARSRPVIASTGCVSTASATEEKVRQWLEAVPLVSTKHEDEIVPSTSENAQESSSDSSMDSDAVIYAFKYKLSYYKL